VGALGGHKGHPYEKTRSFPRRAFLRAGWQALFKFVIARSPEGATKQSRTARQHGTVRLDCFAPLAMTVRSPRHGRTEKIEGGATPADAYGMAVPRERTLPSARVNGHGAAPTGAAHLPAFRRGTCGGEPTPPLSSRCTSGDAAKRRPLSVPAYPRPAIAVAGRSLCRPGILPKPPGNGLCRPVRGNRLPLRRRKHPRAGALRERDDSRGECNGRGDDCQGKCDERWGGWIRQNGGKIPPARPG
jgi:hypothetical protein